MHAPLSMIFFTTLSGAGQGLLLSLFVLDVLARVGLVAMPSLLVTAGTLIVELLCGVGLVAASFHLGHPWRGWRAVRMWRTSWLSREVIALPVFMGLVLLYGASHALGWPALGWGALASAMALVLYVCTGMIYGAVKAIREWATPMTPLNYTLLGIASGALLACALAAFIAPALAPGLGVAALVATLAGAATRGTTLVRNLRLAPKTTLQSAIGVRHPRIVQKSQGAMGGSFNTREFFHGRSPAFVRNMRWAAALLGFALPVGALLFVLLGSNPDATSAATASAGAVASASWPAFGLGLLFLLQYVGLLAERWSFFAEANHPQNLYYRAVS